MTTEERLVRAATRNVTHYDPRPRHTYTAIRVFLTLCTLVALAATAAAHAAHMLPVPATYVITVALFLAIAITWSRS